MNEKLEALFARLFDAKGLRDEMSPENVAGWDSFSHIELIVELESVFGVAIPTSDAVKLDSVGKIKTYLSEKGAA